MDIYSDNKDNTGVVDSIDDIEISSRSLANTLSTPILAEKTMNIDHMYGVIENLATALKATTVDGTNAPDPDLQAHNHNDLLPETEAGMIHKRIIPLSVDEFKQTQLKIKEVQKLTTSLEYRKKQLKNPIRTLEEITAGRIRVAYRLVKYMTHVRGLGAVGQPLVFTMAASTQVNLYDMPIPFDPAIGWSRGLSAVRILLSQANESGLEYSYLLDGKHYTTYGMSVMPPPIHDGYYPDDGVSPIWKYRREYYTPPDYRGDTDLPLAIYLNICELLVRHLDIGAIDTEDQAAVASMLNPEIARLAWPCRDDIETYEEYVLLPHVGKIVANKAQDSAIDDIKENMGLTHSEAFDLVETYKTYAQMANVFDPERERSIMLTKLHNLVETCDEAGMVTTQHNAIKTILQTLGLTRHDEDSNVDRRASLASVLEAETVERAGDQALIAAEQKEDND